LKKNQKIKNLQKKDKEPPKKDKEPLKKEPIKRETPKKETQVPENKPREVAPANNPVSKVLFIKNFVRPLTNKSVEEFISVNGIPPVQFAMDSIKSKLYAIYDSEESAKSARNATHDAIYPSTNKMKLIAEYSTEEEARDFFKKEVEVRQPTTSTSATASPITTPNPKRENSRTSIQKKETPVKPKPVEEKTLDDLFKKTSAIPSLYYLPLSEDEVNEKKRKRESDKVPIKNGDDSKSKSLEQSSLQKDSEMKD